MNNWKLLFLLVLFFLSGCFANKTPKPGVACSFLNNNKDLSNVGRAVFLELGNDSAYPQIASDVTDAFYEAVQKKQFFGLTVLRKNDPSWQNLRLDDFKGYSLEQFSVIRKALKCDAVLRGTITRYEPFPHLIIGLRLELIDLNDGQLLWAIEQIWDASDKSTQDRIKYYYDHSVWPRSESLDVGLGMVSSLKFIKFIAYESAETLKSKR